MMSFLTAVITLRYPPTNNQLRTSSNSRQEATINNERVTIQPIQGRQNSMTAVMSRQYTSGPSGTSRKQRVIVCYNCKGEGHMSKQCIKPKRKRDEAWFKDKIALMMNFSHYGSDNLAEVHNQDNVTNNFIDQDVQATSTSEQSNILNQSEIEITSDSNIISYSQYMNESQYTTVQNSRLPTQQDDLILSVIEQLKTQVVNCTKINQDNKNVNDILTTELERYKNEVRILKEQNNIDKASASCAQSLKIENLKHTLSEHLKENESLEQKNFGNYEESNLSLSTTIVEVVKERTTATTITEGTWGFKHTKACFRDEIIPFVKALKELFNSFDQFLIDELTEVQNVFNQMEQAVKQHCVKKNKFQDKMKDILKENERLLEQAISIDIVNIVINANVNYTSPKLSNNRTAHTDYLRNTQEENATLREIVKSKRLLNPLNNSLDYT
nr:hypothetical protein [Tanacetum cinerariifolium]